MGRSVAKDRSPITLPDEPPGARIDPHAAVHFSQPPLWSTSVDSLQATYQLAKCVPQQLRPFTTRFQFQKTTSMTWGISTMPYMSGGCRRLWYSIGNTCLPFMRKRSFSRLPSSTKLPTAHRFSSVIRWLPWSLQQTREVLVLPSRLSFAPVNGGRRRRAVPGAASTQPRAAHAGLPTTLQPCSCRGQSFNPLMRRRLYGSRRDFRQPARAKE